MFYFMSILYIVCASQSIYIVSVPDYIIVKATSDFRRNFTVNVSSMPLKKVHVFRNQYEVGSCVENICNECQYQGLNCELTNIYYDSNNYMTIQLTIKNIQRTSWDETISVSNGTNLNSALYFKQEYRLNIYTEFEHIDCGFKAVVEGIRMICSSRDIFPNANSFCTYNNTRRIYGICNATNSTDGRFLKNSTCSFNIPKDQLQFGDMPIVTTMYLNITGDEKSDIKFGMNSSSNLHLENPSVTLDAGCTGTSGYILEGQTGHCTCHRTDASDVAPDIVWYYPNNTIATRNSHLTFTAARNSKFICSSRLPFGWSVNYTYSPMVAYGPESVNFSLYPEEEDIHLCEDMQTNERVLTIEYHCSVSVDVFPSLSIEIRQNKTILIKRTDILSVTDSTTVRKGGVYFFSCLAKNSQLGNINVSKTHYKNVIEAPYIPIITIKQTYVNTKVNSMNANSSMIYIIHCEVLGGYPAVLNITLECGSYKSVSVNSTTTTLSVHVTDLKDVNCSCSASHISTCYNNNKIMVPLRDLTVVNPDQEPPHCCFTRSGVLIFSSSMAGTVVLFVVVLVCVITHYKRGWRQCLPAKPETQQQTHQADVGLSATYGNKIYNPEECVQPASIQRHHYSEINFDECVQPSNIHSQHYSEIDLDAVDTDKHYHYYNHVELADSLTPSDNLPMSNRNMEPLSTQHVHITSLDDSVPNTDITNQSIHPAQPSNDGHNTAIDHYSTID